jgi:hypothetical protein
MSEGVIRDFLTLPGIAGVAVFAGRSDPFFYSVDAAFGSVQKETLSQGILQVVETIPESFETFEFRFSEFWVQLHRMRSTLVLLVVANGSLSQENYAPSLIAFKQVLEQDAQAAIALLRAIQTEVPMPTADEVLKGLNSLCSFTAQYLGTPVIVNYLKSSRPDRLQDFQVDRAAQVTFAGEPSKLEQPLSEEEHQLLREWTLAFIRRCSLVVRDFATLVEQDALNPNQKVLLLR